MEETRALLKEIISTASTLKSRLESPEIAEILATSLHNNSRGSLPDRELEALASKAVDKLDAVQEILLPSVTKLVDGFFGFMYSKALSVAVELGIADELAKSGPLTVIELANETGVQPERLDQVLTMCRGNGIFKVETSKDGQRRYANNRASELLRKDHWTQWHYWADLYPNEFYEQFRSLGKAIKVGETRNAAQIEYNTTKSMYEYFADHEPHIVAKFHNTLGAGAVAMAQGLAEDYPWEEIASTGETLLDIGGGSGAFIASLLKSYPNLKGGILDIQSVINHTKPAFTIPGGSFTDVGERMKDFVIGNFLESIPPYSYYTMKWCLHNWGDEDVIRILNNVRKAIIVKPGARFIIVESMMEDGRMGRLMRYANLLMMVSCNGKERGREEWDRIIKQSGWKLGGVWKLRGAWPVAIDLRPE